MAQFPIKQEKRLEIYYETKNLTDPAGEPIRDIDGLKRYVEQYGPERAAGYRDALAHLTMQAFVILRSPSWFKGRNTPMIGDQSANIVKEELVEFHAEKVELLKTIQKFLPPPSFTEEDTLIPSWF